MYLHTAWHDQVLRKCFAAQQFMAGFSEQNSVIFHALVHTLPYLKVPYRWHDRGKTWSMGKDRREISHHVGDGESATLKTTQFSKGVTLTQHPTSGYKVTSLPGYLVGPKLHQWKLVCYKRTVSLPPSSVSWVSRSGLRNKGSLSTWFLRIIIINTLP